MRTFKSVDRIRLLSEIIERFGLRQVRISRSAKWHRKLWLNGLAGQQP